MAFPAIAQSRLSPKVQPTPGLQANPPVLCVDLDGSLIASDVLWECLAALLKKNPLLLLMVPVWFARGIAYGKHRLAEATQLDPADLPYRGEVLDYIYQQKSRGRKIVLATAADKTLAEAVADHLGVFAAVLASDGHTNLKGSAKARRLVSMFGVRGYSYIGNSSNDLKIWATAAAAVVVNPSTYLARQAGAVAPIEKQFTTRRVGWWTALHSIRLHHWAKNLLIFLPMALAHQFSVSQGARAIAAFILFSIAASSMYLVNDLLDLKSDRRHPWKRLRPLASGDLPIAAGFGGLLALLCLSLGLGSRALGPGFALVTAAYCLVVLLYGLRFKKEPLLDVCILASFYVFRIVLGGIVTSVTLSKWFLVYSSFFFLSMALAKRYSELIHAQDLVASGNSGRGYQAGDREVIAVFGIGSALCSIVILCLYIQSRDVLMLYAHPGPLLLVAPVVLYWMARMWLRAHRGELQEDPLTLALTDGPSYLMAAMVLCVIAYAVVHK